MDWSRLARAYDWQLPLERAALAAALEFADPTAHDSVLDLGTGTGALLRELAKHPHRPRVTVGIDDCPAMLERARALPAGWSVQTADARQLPFADGTFSIVTAIYLLHVVDGTARRQIVIEARRVLRPGGRFVVVTPTRPGTRLARILCKPLAMAAGASIGARSAFRPLDPRQELAAAGFTIAETRLVGRGYPSICIRATRPAAPPRLTVAAA